MKLKEYRIPIPLTLEEYRLGQQWTENELLKETFQNCATCLTIFDHSNEQERSDIIKEKIPMTLKTTITSATPMTHKRYNVKDQIPKYLEVLFLKSKTDLILDEYCWDDWPYTLTIIENVEYRLRIIIRSYYRNNHLTSIHETNNANLQVFYSINDEQMKYLNDYEIINIAERLEPKEYHADEDPTKISSVKRPHLLPLQFNSKWYENWSTNNSSMCVYKLIELVMFDGKVEEKSFLTKAANKILWSTITKTQKMIYHRFHQKLICNIDRWIDRTIENVRDDEKTLRRQLSKSQSPLVDSNKKEK